jgi:predicted dithiol-disulfide oxidoreductase (DUF899 family)
MSHLNYPNESAEYREARNKLLAEEIALRRQIEAVAERRRALPPGGEVAQDYLFERIGKNLMPEKVEMSKLFGRHHTLILYSFMYGPEREAPCPMCTHLLDSVSGAARHVGERASLYIVAKSPIARLVPWARGRGWDDLDFLSTAGTVTTPIISAIRRSCRRRCAKSASRTARTMTRRCSTCFVSTMDRSVISGGAN